MRVNARAMHEWRQQITRETPQPSQSTRHSKHVQMNYSHLLPCSTRRILVRLQAGLGHFLGHAVPRDSEELAEMLGQVGALAGSIVLPSLVCA